LKYGAASAVLIDIDERSLAHARRNLSEFRNADVRFHSIYEPVEPGTFDIAFSIGVVHHLENQPLAVRRLAEAVKPGGLVLVWLYGRENNGWIVHLLDPIRINVLSKLPLGFVHVLSWFPTAALWVGLRLGFGRIAYFKLLRRLSFRHLRAIVFDHLIPRIAKYYRHDEAEALLRGAGLENVRATWVNEMSWSVTGRRPAQ
jgi:SAM-dependent methyltransferase